ncbi:MAG TPA: 3-methyl-2-oxobutanoate hydroxymethyltransferase [Methylomirabilota bacterium]|nr:3-methyl-2-oxobutanoate hydroxymethyltransferase [Methylomirabilota bacterium]
MAKVTIPDLQKMKLERKKIVVMTAYDYSMASIIDRANVDMLLVGDSGGRNLLGHHDNNAVTMDEMVLMTRSVSRGATHALVIGDMPFMSYQVSIEEALRNAGRLIQEAGAQAVKLEVGADYAPTVEAIVKAGIPVMGHMGLTPMATIGAGGFRSEGLQIDEEQVWRDAQALEAAGAFSLLLTGISADLAKRITQKAKVPTIAGFGAGNDCDGQIGVTHGVVGFNAGELDKPKAAYGPVGVALFEAARKFTEDVRGGKPIRSRQDRS